MNFPIKRFTVSGDSMLPTLKSGQELLVWCWFLGLKVGDLVVFKAENRLMVKRIKSLNPEGIIVEGDNKNGSTDSRKFGMVSRSKIVGKVIWTQTRESY